MIGLVFTGMCAGCPHADITVEKGIGYAAGKHLEAEYIARCEHEDACTRLTGRKGNDSTNNCPCDIQTP